MGFNSILSPVFVAVVAFNYVVNASVPMACIPREGPYSVIESGEGGSAKLIFSIRSHSLDSTLRAIDRGSKLEETITFRPGCRVNLTNITFKGHYACAVTVTKSVMYPAGCNISQTLSTTTDVQKCGRRANKEDINAKMDRWTLLSEGEGTIRLKITIHVADRCPMCEVESRRSNSGNISPNINLYASDYNECLTTSHLCPAETVCRNQMAGYTCESSTGGYARPPSATAPMTTCSADDCAHHCYPARQRSGNEAATCMICTPPNELPCTCSNDHLTLPGLPRPVTSSTAPENAQQESTKTALYTALIYASSAIATIVIVSVAAVIISKRAKCCTRVTRIVDADPPALPMRNSLLPRNSLLSLHGSTGPRDSIYTYADKNCCQAINGGCKMSSFEPHKITSEAPNLDQGVREDLEESGEYLQALANDLVADHANMAIDPEYMEMRRQSDKSE